MMLWPTNRAISTHLQTIDAGVDIDRIRKIDAQQDDVQVEQWAKLEATSNEKWNRVGHWNRGGSRVGSDHWNHE